MKQLAVLGLGGNLGDRLARFTDVLTYLQNRKILTDLRCSEIFESEALLLPGSPASWNIPFYNIAVSGQTDLSPRELLSAVKQIESELGRARRERWAPREIDIDILSYGNTRLEEPDLTIPHVGLAERPFALWPLAALTPEFLLGVPGSEAECSAETAARRWGFVRSEIPCRTWRADNRAQGIWRKLVPNLRIPLVHGPFAPTELMGVLNITPDSFSDGGNFLSSDAALVQAKELYAQGASVLDLGAESTRPQSAALSAEEEWKRLEPALSAVHGHFAGAQLKPLLSVDTRHATVARQALDCGADWLNDVTGFSDPEMLSVAAASECDLVVMHSLGIPPSKERTLSPRHSAISQILAWGEKTLSRLAAAGIERERVILDPGIGFGKTAEQSAEILGAARNLRALGVRILIGHSRKSFLSLWTERPASERDPETAILSAHLASSGIEYLRVHDVARSSRAIHSLWRPAAGTLSSS